MFGKRIAITGAALLGLFVGLLSAPPLASAGSGAVDVTKFNSIDVFELEYGADPRISPDGKSVVYVRRSMDIMTDKVRSNLWIVDADGENHRPLLSGTDNYSSPRWSPDGKRLVYVAEADDKPQLFVRWMDSGQTALITHLTESPSAITWSPDGQLFAFTMAVKAKKKSFAVPPAKPEGAKWAEPVKVIDTVVYRHDGAGIVEPSHDHVFVVPAHGGTPRRLTQGDFDHNGPLSWTPDGKWIVFSANREEEWQYNPVESEVWSVRVESGYLRQLTHRDGPDRAPVVSPNGRYIAYVGYDDKLLGYHNQLLYVMNHDGSNRRALTADMDHSVRNVQWGPDGRGLYFLFDDRGVRKLGYTNLNGKIKTILEGIGGTSLGRPYISGSYTVARNGSVAYTLSKPDRPADVGVAFKRGAARQLTQLNEDLLDHKVLGDVHDLTWTSSFDGRQVHGWVVTPPDFDTVKEYPLILEIHGGPFAAYGPSFSAEVQRYAAEGYVVLYANPRGSTSYGADFANLIHHNYPGQDYDDLMSGVDQVLALGYVDSDNLFVTGGSGGGVLSAWIVGKTNRFRAAVVAKPVINWTSFALTADGYPFYYKYWFPATPWDDPMAYWKRSPLSLVGNVNTPTMLLTGEADARTPITESEQFYQALQLRKIDTAMVRVPGASHGIARRPSNLIAKVDNILGWFENYRTDLEREPNSTQAQRK